MGTRGESPVSVLSTRPHSGAKAFIFLFSVHIIWHGIEQMVDMEIALPALQDMDLSTNMCVYFLNVWEKKMH